MNNGVDIICDICPNVKMSLTKTVGAKQSGKQYRMRWFKCPVCGMSDLIKPIEHKGEKFVPIIELAKVAFTNSRYSFKLSEGLDKFVWIDDDWNNFKFYFEGYNFHYDGYNRFIPNQFKLYQKLIEWHFDIADLISKREAIDVNTLKENPYK